ncbi:MAG: N-acetyltransferase [Cyclobacteriaceae bacterium]|nr:MAG: N-acetyltransferase [Cyclobacteriaceae bacterium]
MKIRPIRPEDNAVVAQIIRTVMPEFGAGGKGFALHDAEVDDMYTAYNQPRSVYYVCEVNGKVVGGGGIGPLQGGDENTCELKKMYFLPEGRGHGWGQQVLDRCLQSARQFGFTWCYLETFHTMQQAMRLYEKNGFERIVAPCGSTGHFACDTFYRLRLL